MLYVTAAGGDEGDWRTLRPGPGRLFIVGRSEAVDLSLPPRRHRRLRRREVGPLAGTVKSIVQNFRSHPAIIAWINGVFDRLLVAEQGVQPGNTAARAARPLASMPVGHRSLSYMAAAKALGRRGARGGGRDRRRDGSAGRTGRALACARSTHQRGARRAVARYRDPDARPYGSRALH